MVRYVALGDSLAAAGAGESSYATWVARHVQRLVDGPVTVHNFAYGGWTSGEILGALRKRREVRSAVTAADVVTVNGGGNDLLRARIAFELAMGGSLDGEIEAFGRRWDAILAELVALRGAGAGVVALEMYHPFVDAEIRAGTFGVAAERMRRVNHMIGDAARRRGIGVAPVHAAFNGPDGRRDAAAAELVLWDGVHPSVAGARVIAGAIAEVLPDRFETPAYGSRAANLDAM